MHLASTCELHFHQTQAGEMNEPTEIRVSPSDTPGAFPYLKWLAAQCGQDLDLVWGGVDGAVRGYAARLSATEKAAFRKELRQLAGASSLDDPNLFERYWFDFGAEHRPEGLTFHQFLEWLSAVVGDRELDDDKPGA